MMFTQMLRSLRKEKGLSQRELGAHVGVTQQMVGKWEKGSSTPDPSMLARIAELLEVSVDALLGVETPEDARPVSRYDRFRIPVVGTVKAGYGALAFEEDYGSEYADVKDPDNYFYLVVRGDSMEPRIQDGDLALVHKQPTLDNGDLGVLVYGDGEGTLKKFVVRGNAVVLHPFNPAYEDLVLRGEELEQLHVVGKVVKTVTQW
ncbi:MAG: helix-turn-helix domain-containing protein [Oscillospiraceae bacterium]|nr:helix-turn-helix domain-containing protein [Oscillospiraceae bacterium]